MKLLNISFLCRSLDEYVMDILIGRMLLVAVFFVLRKAEGQGDVDCPRGRCNDGRCPRKNYDRCPEQPCKGSSLRRCVGSLACLPIYSDCPGEHCGEWTCADGTCVLVGGQCPDGSIGCFNNLKRCQDGHCIARYQYCPEEPCHAKYPFKCDNTCKLSSVICDGIKQCASGDDELYCISTRDTTAPKPTVPASSSTNWQISTCVFIVAFMIFFCLFIRICIRNCCTSKRKRNGGVLAGVDLDQIQQQHIWSTTSDRLASDDWTFHESRTGSDQSRERTSNISLHNPPPLSDDWFDVMPTALPIDSSGMPYISRSDAPSDLHSQGLPPSYNEAMAHPNLYPTT